MLAIASILAALTLVVTTTSLHQAAGIANWAIHPGVVVAVHLALRRPFAEAATTMLIVAWATDLLASGPPGVDSLVLTLVFLGLWGLAQRVGGRYVLAAFTLALGGSLVLDLAEALLLSLFYPSMSGLAIFARTGLFSAAATALVAAPYFVAMTGLERFWATRSERSVTVD